MSGLSGRTPRRSAGTIVVPVITGPLDACRTQAARLAPKHAFPGGDCGEFPGIICSGLPRPCR